MASTLQAWLANDDNEEEGVWENWYTDQVNTHKETSMLLLFRLLSMCPGPTPGLMMEAFDTTV